MMLPNEPQNDSAQQNSTLHGIPTVLNGVLNFKQIEDFDTRTR